MSGEISNDLARCCDLALDKDAIVVYGNESMAIVPGELLSLFVENGWGKMPSGRPQILSPDGRRLWVFSVPENDLARLKARAISSPDDCGYFFVEVMDMPPGEDVG